MKNTGKNAQKKSSSKIAPGAKRTGSGGGARRTGTPIEARFRAVFENSRDAIGIVRAGVHVLVNPAYLELFGFPRGTSLAGKPVLDLIAPGSRDQVKAFILPRVRGESAPSTYETRGLRADGSVFDMEVSVSTYHENGEEHNLVILRDITQRMIVEEEISERGAVIQQIMDNASVAIFLVDRSGRIVHANRRMAEMFGCSMEELEGSEYVNHVDPLERETSRRTMLALLASEIPSVDLERLYLRRDGTQFWGQLAGRRLKDAHGNEIGLVGVITDITERILSEDARRESEERFKAITTTASDAILLMNDTGKIVYWNPAAGRMFGYSSDEALGKDLHLFLGPERLHGNFQKGFGNFVKTGQGPVINRTVELAAHRKDDTEFPIEVSTSAMNIGGRWYALGIIRDISERKRAEQEIREKEGKYRVLFEAANDGIFIQDATGFVDCNKKGAEMYGLPKEKIIGRSPIEFSPVRQPDGRTSSEVAAEKIRAALNGVTQVFEWQPLRDDGSSLDVEVTLSRLELGGSVYLQSIVRDISERKRAEHALRSSEARFRSIIEHASTGILVADSETRQILYANPEICRMLGYSEQEFLALKATELAIPKEASLSSEGFAAHAEGKIEATERTIRRKDGSFIWMSINSVRIEYDGRPCMVGFFMDITERRLLEDERLKTQKLESLGTLAGGIAHDFNNLLQGVFGFISMARLTFDQREKSLAMLDQAEKALHQSVNLTSHLLTFSKGGKPLKRVFALRPLIENSVKFALSGSRVTYEIAIDDDIRAVEADEGQIGQVIQNIVLNADQAMPLGGRIEVSVRNMPAAAITAPPAGLQGDFVEISIRDQGIGIPPEQLTRIFDPYFTTKEKGSGLGLTTVYSIIKNHGGLVRVQSEAGKGTTFLIYLPASATPAKGPKSPVISAVARKGRILVMDDEEMIRSVAGELLTAMGHEVVCAESGETALEAYRAARDSGRPFDVVILDLTIRGGMGGLETMRKLTEIDPDVRAVVSSGYSNDTVLSNYRDQGFQAFLKKPYNFDDLVSTLNALLA